MSADATPVLALRRCVEMPPELRSRLCHLVTQGGPAAAAMAQTESKDEDNNNNVEVERRSADPEPGFGGRADR